MSTPRPTAADGEAAGAPTGARRAAIVVTGASEGIGLAIAHRFAESLGLPVVMIARRAEPLEAAAREVATTHGVETVPLPLDVTHIDAAARIEEVLETQRLHAEILVNNAGVGLGGPFLSHDGRDIAALLDLNIRALTLLTRHFLPGMIERRRGGIINVASLGGYAPGPYQAAYYASKAYVISLSRALAYETGGQGVHVCAVAPGPVATGFHRKMGADTALYRWLVPGTSARAVARTTWLGWRLGLHVIQPGMLGPVLALLMRLSPWTLLVPILGWLLGKRYPRA